MKQYEQFWIQKSAQAFDDTLAAFGLAVVVQELLVAQGGGRITIKDQGAYYELLLSNPLHSQTVEQRASLLMPRGAISTAKTKLPDAIRKISYEGMREEVQAYYAIPREQRDAEGIPSPPKEWDVLRAINPASLPGYNSLMANWFIARQKPETLFTLLDLYAAFPNDVEKAEVRWKELDKQYGWKISVDATRQQLYNPDSGKGQNKPKADGLSIGNVKSFWLSEWLKAIGFYEVALTKLLRGVKDRKTIVLAPKKLTFEQHQQIMSRFSESMRMSESSIRFDILAALRYVLAMLDYAQEDQSFLQLLGLEGAIKHRLVSGFYTAFYKDMGNAIATMNLSFVALPGWVVIQTTEDPLIYKEILDEFVALVRQFDESHSDDVTLLQHLRDFVSGDDLEAFYRFTTLFPAFYMGKRERNQYARQLTTAFIERLVMSTDKRLGKILESQGFQNIAYAIRQATVTAQYRKLQKDKKYEVRYGLGQELARKARYPQDFIQALSDFLHKYNAENARVMETRPQPYRRSIQTSDIDEIVQLIDEFDSATIANMLIAYGYARVPRESPEEEPVDIEDSTEE